jgi:hypothetical protein
MELTDPESESRAERDPETEELPPPVVVMP